MVNINPSSVRDELDRLKHEFNRLNKEDAIPSETKLLMQSMFTLLELIFSIFLEKKTLKTSKNSSKPSSQTDKDESSLDHLGGKGKGKREKTESAYNSRTVESITISVASTCNIWGGDLDGIDCQEHERRTKIDIILEKVIEHVDAEIKTCPSCATNVKGPLQYGNGLKAYVLNMLVCQMVALSRVQKGVAAMIGQTLSEATLLKFVLQLNEALADWEKEAIQQLTLSPVLHVDETSLRVDKQNHWIHMYASGDITLKRLHRRRGKEAIEKIAIIPDYGGVIIHDCWASYLSYHHCGHGLCGSHLLRELTFIVDSNAYVWAKNMQRALQETCKAASSRNEKCLSEKEYLNLQKRYRSILTRGEKELPEIPPKPNGQRGKMAKSDAHNLWERLKERP